MGAVGTTAHGIGLHTMRILMDRIFQLLGWINRKCYSMKILMKIIIKIFIIIKIDARLQTIY